MNYEITYDTQAILPIDSENSKIIEIGSGAGFPSVPIKIERSDVDFTLLEANEKKCWFLNEVKSLLGFENFEIVCGRAEEFSKKEDFRESYDHAVARAVAPLNVLSELILPFVKTGGCAVSYKGANFKEEIEKAKEAIKMLGGEIAGIKTYSLPEDMGERALVIIKKVFSTPEEYPRRFNKIKKCPL